MLLSHYLPAAILNSVFTFGLDSEIVTLDSSRFMLACPFFTSVGLEESNLEPTEDMAVIRVQKPAKSLSMRWVRWTDHVRKHGLVARDPEGSKPETIWFHRGPISPSAFHDCRLLTGETVTWADVFGQPIVRGTKTVQAGATWLDCSGADVTARVEAGDWAGIEVER